MARVLVVDDEEGVRSFLAEALLSAGYEVEACKDGAEAYRKLASWAPVVLVTDMKMPGLDGLELLRRSRAEHPNVEVIVLTAHGSVSNAVSAMKLGAFDYLEKPLESPTALRRLVERALAKAGGGKSSSFTERPLRLSWGAKAMAEVEATLRKVAATDATVLLLGESGTGKEVAARWIHAQSRRANGPFVAVNCATLSEHLLESDLFGHEKGAFTGATARRQGKIEQAERGTFFLDEVGELKPDLQTKLLRVIQERRFERVGGSATLMADVRWLAATNRDLTSEMRAGRFREDLFHRLAVFPVELPPLRERREDIPPLAEALLHRIGQALGKEGLRLEQAALALLASADWSGNVREMSNALERAAILAEGPLITTEVLLRVMGVASPAVSLQAAAPTMEEAERAAIEKALSLCGGNRKKAAEHLGIGLRTLYEKLKKYGIR